jgi:glycosyltransferase involved in cell wall biosynthesis
MPLLSIITVCKNPGFLITETVNSVLSQSFKNYEYIIVDSNSTDGTSNYLRRLSSEKKIDKLIIEQDDGIYQAINKGIKIAKGNYVGVIHAGDTYCKDIFKLLLPSLDDKNDIIYGSGFLKYYNLEKYIELAYDSHKKILKKNSILHPSTFIKKKLYQQLGSFNESFVIAGDFDFFNKAFKRGYKFKQLQLPFTNISFGGISSQLSYILISVTECADIIFGINFSIKKYLFILKQLVLQFINICKIKILLIVKFFKILFF